jgi:endonuclease YncB( thermonuclease family)
VATTLLLGTAGVAQAATPQAGATGTQAVSGFASPAAAASTKTKWTRAKVIRWVDGDTVVTTEGTIRLIGVDTPEKGRCGAAKATRLANRAAPRGSVVRLGNPRSVDNKDRYNRKLRYVVKKSSKVDISAKHIRKGSKARYDSKDGYDWHPRQAKYRRLDRNNADYRCGSTSKPDAPTTSSWQTRANEPVSSANPDINCGDIPNQYRPIRITGPDYHGLDRDGDGSGCDI